MKKLMHTLQGRYIVMFVATVLPVLGLLMGINLYLNSLARSQLLQGSEAVLNSYAAQQAATLEAMRGSLADVATADSEFDSMQYLPEGNERIRAQVNIYNRLRSRVAQYGLLRIAFAYSGYSGGFLSYEGERLSFAEKESLRAAGRAWVQQAAQQRAGGWELREWEGTQYLVYLFHSGDTFVGGAVQAADVLHQAPAADAGGGALLYRQGEAVAGFGEVAAALPGDMAPVSQYVRAGGEELLAAAAALGDGYTIVTLVPAQGLLRVPPVPQMAFILISVFCFLLFPAVFLISSYTFVRPVKNIVQTMSAVSEGDLKARVDTSKMAGLEEFSIIGDTFNRSVEQVQRLTGEIYEKELDRRKAQLRSLRMQINPHFLMNSLNIIFTASRAQNSDTVQRMCTYLSRYFRYSMNVDRDLVPLADEAAFTDDYLHIQELRFENRFEYDILIPPFLKSALVPPMVLKTFAENSIKYAVGTRSYVQLFLKARLVSENGKAFLELVAEDTGPGYPQWMLDGAGGGAYDTEKHTGVWNIHERLRLLYGGEAQISFGTRQGGGARTVVLLPMQTERGGERDDPDLIGG